MSINRISWINMFLVSLVFAVSADAQVFKTIVQFDGSDGGNPFSTLTQGTDENYYGTTQEGGNYNCGQIPGCGTIFKLSPQGKFTTLYTFCVQQPCSDGISPWAGLVLGTDGNFYGTTYSGGNVNSAGTVFKITPFGKLTTLYAFCRFSGCPDGSQPSGQLIQGADGNFYGTTRYGGTEECLAGTPGCGTVFRITPSGSLTTIHAFTPVTNLDGSIPSAGLTMGPDGNFYGTTSQGGYAGTWCVDYVEESGCGTVFKITPAGSETVLYRFCVDQQFCSTDGALPFGGLVLARDGNFYGAAWGGGGAEESGTLFKISPQGQFTEL